MSWIIIPRTDMEFIHSFNWCGLRGSAKWIIKGKGSKRTSEHISESCHVHCRQRAHRSGFLKTEMAEPLWNTQLSLDRQDSEPNGIRIMMRLVCFTIYYYQTNFDTRQKTLRRCWKEEEGKTYKLMQVGGEKKTHTQNLTSILKKILPGTPMFLKCV